MCGLISSKCVKHWKHLGGLAVTDVGTDRQAPASLLTSREAATILAISPRLLWSLTASGVLPCVRIGRAVRYDPRDLQGFIERRKKEAVR